MALVTQVLSNSLGAFARAAWNLALASVGSGNYETGARTLVKSYTFGSQPAANGTDYIGGFYEAPAADANLTQASLTVVLGTANISYAAHAFTVAALAGVTDGSDLVLTITGTSITDAGVRSAADSEVIIADCTAEAVDDYTESLKKWIGQITYTLSSTGGAAFNFDFNYGFANYENLNDVNYTVTGFEAKGLCNASDAGFNIELLRHDTTGWTYSAAAFVAGNTAILNMDTDHNTEVDITAGEPFGYKRTAVATAVTGASAQGIIIRVTTSVNAAVQYMNCQLTVTF